MWIMWLVIVLAIAMVVGPVMMLRPLPGVSKLAKLRTAASQQGLTVRLSNLYHDANRQHAIYSLPHSKKIRDKGPIAEWALEKTSFTHEMHFHNRWDWRGANRSEAASQKEIAAFLDKLPPGIEAIEFNAAGLGFQWDEYYHGESEIRAISELHALLNELAQLLE